MKTKKSIPSIELPRRTFLSRLLWSLAAVSSFPLLKEGGLFGLPKAKASDVNILSENEIVQQLNESVKGETGKKLKVVACVLRNDGSGWKIINTSNHNEVNVLSVTNDTSAITVNFSFTAKNVISFMACPDEQMTMQGIRCGSSVTQDKALITLARDTEIGACISYSGSVWNSTNAAVYGWGITPITNLSWDKISSRLTIQHANFGDTNYGKVRSLPMVSPWGGGVIPSIFSFDNSSTSVEFYDYTGTKITAPTTACKCYFKRSGNGVLNPNDYTNAQGNIWCYAIFEVD
jgi:hypothetical protein